MSNVVKLSYTSYPDHEHMVDPMKKPLVFLHGLFGSKANLHSVSKHLSDNRKVITYDARNHGDSEHHPEMNFVCMAEDLSRLIDDLNLNKPVVMGHSMGARTTMTFALSQPHKLTGLIVVDSSPGKSPAVKEAKIYAEAMKTLNIRAGTPLSQARNLAWAHLAPLVENQNVLQFLLTNLKQFEGGEVRWKNNIDAFLNNYNALGEFPLENASPFIKPTLFVFGADSPHLNSPGVSKIKSLFPNSDIRVIKGAGHFVHVDKPLEFVKIVNLFLEDVDSISD